MRVIPVAEFDQWLEETRNADPLALLVGSALSIASGLPTGKHVGTLLADLLADDIPTKDLVHGLVKDTAFEHIMEACPAQEALRQVVAGIYNIDAANDGHEAIARLVGAGAVHHVITTNYDRCFETAFRSIGIQRVVRQDHLAGWQPDQPTYFKIHGCASDLETLVFTLSGEPALEPWKRDLLAWLVAGHRLIVIGYSGLDFEICPELLRLKPRLAWVCLDRPQAQRPYRPSPGAIGILALDTSTAVQGDMHDVIGKLGTARPNVKERAAPALPKETFIFGSSRDEISRNLDLWRCQLFRHLGCARAGAACARRLIDSARGDAQCATAHHYAGLAAFHAGKYRRAGREYRAAAALVAPPSNDGYLFDAVIADRCAGLNKQALESLEVLAEQAPQYRAQLLLRRLEFLAPAYERARARCRDDDAHVIQAQALPLVRELAGVSDQPGARLEHQQCDLLARRLDISDQISTVAYAPAPARAGFSQLGYFVAMAMALRQDLMEGNDPPTLKQALFVFADLDRMGAAAETWKFGLAVLSRYRFRSGYTLSIRVVINYARCEYTWAQRKSLVTELLWRVRRRHA